MIVSGSQSGWGPVISGVPQGSVLGPVLFLVFINDIPVNIQSPVYLFADDTKICRTIKNNDDSNSLQDDIFEACNWANKWQLTFNTNKCKHMHIGNKPSENTYYIKDSNIKTSQHHN